MIERVLTVSFCLSFSKNSFSSRQTTERGLTVKIPYYFYVYVGLNDAVSAGRVRDLYSREQVHHYHR